MTQQYDDLMKIFDLETFVKQTDKTLTEKQFIIELSRWLQLKCKENNDGLLLPKKSLPSRT